MITVYSLPVCPNCDNLKLKLKNNNIKFNEKNLEEDDTILELLMDSVTIVEAPIIKIKNKYYDGISGLKELNI